jgi:hypothetical protein
MTLNAQARKKAVIVRDVTRITHGYDRAVAAHGQLPEGAQPDEFKPLAEALIELNKAVYAAYGDQPIEADAWDARQRHVRRLQAGLPLMFAR